MTTLSCGFTDSSLENQFMNEYATNCKPFDTMTLGLNALISHLPRTGLVNTVDIMLRATLSAWAGLSTAITYKSWRMRVVVFLRLWFSVLPLVLLYALRNNLTSPTAGCPRSSIVVAVVGNSIVYPLTHQLPFSYHAPLTIVGFITSALLVAAPGGCCAVLISNSSSACSLWYQWVVGGVPGSAVEDTELRATCGKMLISIQGGLMTTVSCLLLW